MKKEKEGVFKKAVIAVVIGASVGGAATVIMSAAHANEGRWYIDGALGSSNLTGLEEYLLDTGSKHVSGGHNFSFKVGGGYQITDYLGIEGVYLWHDTVKDCLVSVDTYSLSFNLVGYFPVNEKLSLVGKAGSAFTSSSADVLGVTIEENHTSISYGAGANIKLTDHVYITAEYFGSGIDGDQVSRFDGFYTGIKYFF